jgi:hypothetical protein
MYFLVWALPELVAAVEGELVRPVRLVLPEQLGHLEQSGQLEQPDLLDP